MWVGTHEHKNLNGKKSLSNFQRRVINHFFSEAGKMGITLTKENSAEPLRVKKIIQYSVG